MIAITGATGQLGRLTIAHLLSHMPATQVVAIVRDPAKASAISGLGVVVKHAHYGEPAALEAALDGVERLLLISSSEIGRRTEQHGNVVAAAQRQRVKLLAYTSLLHADTSPLNLADEHRETESIIRASGIPHVILRNGWYTENHTGAVSAALSQGVLFGSAGTGRISWATRADYAAAAAKVLLGTIAPNRTYELAGDLGHSLADLAAEISRQSGKAISYVDLPPRQYAEALQRSGLPEWLAAAIASWDAGAAQGALHEDGRQLSQLIGRPTTSLSTAVTAALKT